jgi:membrane protein YqaA with SNARE-associated domain
MMLRGLYNWVMRLSASRHAIIALFAIAFAESSFFPVPPDVMLAPMVLARPDRTWRYAAVCTVGSIIGGMLGYAIGHELHPVGHFLLAITGNAGAEPFIRAQVDRFGVFFILALGLVPIPYKILTITTGMFNFPLWQLVAASCVTRSVRFFGVSALVRRFGPTLLPVIERRLLLASTLVVVAVIAILAAVHLLTQR